MTYHSNHDSTHDSNHDSNHDDRAPRAGFIVGAARSGTSLLYKALCLHPEAAYLSNYVEHFPSFPSLTALNRVARRLPSVRRNVWFGQDSNAYVYGRRRPLGHRLFPMPVEGECLFQRAGFTESPSEREAPRSEQRRRLVRAVRTVQRASGGTVFLSKRISNGQRMPQLVYALPTARFVSIVRDGRAVACSLTTVNWWPNTVVWWYGSTPRQWEAEGRDPWELCARNWVEEVRQIALGSEAVPPGQLLSVRYEDLVAHPIETLEQVARFFGLCPDARWSESISTLRFPDRNERWRAELPAKAVTLIEEIQSETLLSYGYPLETVHGGNGR